MTLAALLKAASISPIEAPPWPPPAGACEAAADIAFAWVINPALLCVATGPRSQSIFKLLRALFAIHQESLTITTPAGTSVALTPTKGAGAAPPRPARGAWLAPKQATHS